MNKLRPCIVAIALVAAFGLAASPAQAATICVPNMWHGTCTISQPTITAAVGAAVAGDKVFFDNGVYNENNILVTNGITIQGRTRAGAVVDCGASGNGFKITAGGVRMRYMTVQNCSQGLRYENAGATLNADRVFEVTLQNHTSRCIEVHNATTMTNMTVGDSLFDDCNTGMRFASSAVGDNITLRRVTMQNMPSGLGFYEANDGSTGYVRRLEVDDCDFIDSGWAVYGEELEDVTVQNSRFTDNDRGVYLWRVYNGAGRPAGDITITGNTFTDTFSHAIRIWAGGNNQLDLPVLIDGNTFTADVAKVNSTFHGMQIGVELQSVGGGGPWTHAPVTIQNNRVTFGGTWGAGPSSAYAVRVRGNFDGVGIHFNTFDGGGVGDNGQVPATSGVFIASNNDYYGQAPAGAVLSASCNNITGFVNGVVVYDESTAAPGVGGLAPGAVVDFENNNIYLNSSFGMLNGPGETIDAENNWWGTMDGPSGAGPGSGDAVSAFVDYDPFQVWPLDELCEPLEVRLDSFSVEQTAEGVLLRWSTRGERDTAGFRVVRTRDQRKTDTAQILTERLIPAMGSDLQGGQYEYLDATPQAPGRVVYYLEDVDFYGKVTRHGPVFVDLTGTRTREPARRVRGR